MVDGWHAAASRCDSMMGLFWFVVGSRNISGGVAECFAGRRLEGTGWVVTERQGEIDWVL